MEGFVVVGIWIFCALGAAIGFPCAFKSLRARRLIENLPTAKAKGVFIGLVELKGTAECEVDAAIVAPISRRRCVYVVTSVEEERLETYRTTRNGRTVTRRRRVWITIARKSRRTAFYLRDETGAVRVDPNGANIETQLIFDQTLGRSQPEFFAWADGVGEASNSCGRRRFREVGVPLHSDVYVLGKARLRKDAVAAEIAADPDEPTFLIARTEESARDERFIWEKCSLLWAWIGYVVVAAGLSRGFGSNGEPDLEWAFWVGSAVYAAVWGVCSVVALANSLIDLRRRVDQAKANVDVELKRRADLLPALADAAKCLARYERERQTTLAALRAQAAVVRVDGAEAFGPSALAPRLFAVGEKYPELGSNQAFARLRSEIVDAEDRIALAREYYNDVAENYETRRQTVPYCYVAPLLKLPKAKFFEAEGFVAKTVDVDLETSTSETGESAR